MRWEHKYPDNIAEKDGKPVTIEFEANSCHLKNHFKVAEKPGNNDKETLIEKEGSNIVIKPRPFQPKEPPLVLGEYPKEKYEAVRGFAA